MSRITKKVLVPTVVVMLMIAQLTPWLSNNSSLKDCFTGLYVNNFLLVGRIMITTWPYDYLPGYNPFLSLWFTFALFLCYLFIPLLKLICADTPSARKLKVYILCLGFVFFIVRVTLLNLFPHNFTFQHLDWWIEQKPFYWLWVMILGHEIGVKFGNPDFKLKWKDKLRLPSLLLYLMGGTVLFFMTMKWNISPEGQVNQRYFNREFLIYVIAQLGMFLFFVSLSPGKGILAKVILFVADKSFYIYIIHEAVYHKLLYVLKTDLSTIGNYILFGILTFMVSLFFAVILKKTEKSAINLVTRLVTGSGKRKETT
jgi:peptidoglycan/LPS O-acetylase OafA/YrhL